MKTVVDKWEEATENVAKAFTKKYFPDYIDDHYNFWVGDCIGDVFSVSDMFFGLDRMIEALRMDVTFDQLYDYYNYELDHAISKDSDKPTPINFKNYTKGLR